ncbi:MAG: hypothetical protein HF962_07805 [Sulfurovum sp.]|nr:hypothetical protein [Sulfurovum sp.]
MNHLTPKTVICCEAMNHESPDPKDPKTGGQPQGIAPTTKMKGESICGVLS